MKTANLDLASLMAEHDIKSWQAHDAKDSITLMAEMARLYELEYGLSYDDAYGILGHFVTAAWLHDIAETAEDAHDQSVANRYWRMVEPSLITHYALLLEKMQVDDAQNRGKQVAHYDLMRWKAHHRRNQEKYVYCEAKMNMLILDMSYDEACTLARCRSEAVWLHNQVDLAEKEGRPEVAAKLWQQVQETLLVHYQAFLEIMAKHKAATGHALVKTTAGTSVARLAKLHSMRPLDPPLP